MPTSKDTGRAGAYDAALYNSLNKKNDSYNMQTEWPGKKGAKMILKNNMMLAVSVRNPKNNEGYNIGTFRIDINGKKGPNRYGYDVFFFGFDEKGIQTSARPYTLTGTRLGHEKNCYKNSPIDGWVDGMSCSLWILRHNNMDYKYRDVSAEW